MVTCRREPNVRTVSYLSLDIRCMSPQHILCLMRTQDRSRHIIVTLTIQRTPNQPATTPPSVMVTVLDDRHVTFGVAIGAPWLKVRSLYWDLILQHHPDKLEHTRNPDALTGVESDVKSEQDQDSHETDEDGNDGNDNTPKFQERSLQRDWSGINQSDQDQYEDSHSPESNMSHSKEESSLPERLETGNSYSTLDDAPDEYHTLMLGVEVLTRGLPAHEPRSDQAVESATEEELHQDCWNRFDTARQRMGLPSTTQDCRNASNTAQLTSIIAPRHPLHSIGYKCVTEDTLKETPESDTPGYAPQPSKPDSPIPDQAAILKCPEEADKGNERRKQRKKLLSNSGEQSPEAKKIKR